MVWDDRQFHMEFRSQTLPALQATLHIYESTLTSLQFQKLLNALNADSVAHLPIFPEPQYPFGIPQAFFFTAQRSSDSKDVVGYLAWDKQSEISGLPPTSTPDTIKQKWLDSAVALQPITIWLHEIMGMNWQEVPPTRSSLCGVYPTE
ncbi:hypothetical protein BDD14_2331 [Edaphobacter modestus]|uniref:Uncharacterized protein n=1 Tax=Edaphobacter modestus TaxID=388466 RepID=A0A4Q7YV19_9BACT|nr:hypothetical protein BDD14_2331 [Edaphobacter modestus]